MHTGTLLPATLLTIAMLLGATACSDRSADSAVDAQSSASPGGDARAVWGYEAERVAANTWVIHGPEVMPNPDNQGFMNNPAFVTTTGGVVVIDPGSSVYTGEMLLREIARVTAAPVIAVFNTHIHGDHWLGNDAIAQAYPDAAIYGHSKMIEMVDAGAGLEWIDLLSNMTDGATDGTTIVKPDRATDGNETLGIGGHDFDIIHLGKAHTATDIMILHRQDMVLFSGDNACNGVIRRIDNGSFPGNVATLQAGIDIAPRVVVPGHGRTGDAGVLEAYQRYLATLYEQVEAGYDEGLSDFEIKPQVHAALTAYHDWGGYEDEVGKHVSQAYLEVEAAAF